MYRTLLKAASNTRSSKSPGTLTPCSGSIATPSAAPSASPGLTETICSLLSLPLTFADEGVERPPLLMECIGKEFSAKGFSSLDETAPSWSRGSSQGVILDEVAVVILSLRIKFGLATNVVAGPNMASKRL